MRRLIGAGLLGASLALGWFWMDYAATVDAPLLNTSKVSFTLRKGGGVTDLISAVKRLGLSDKVYWMRLMIFLTGAEKRLKFGDYEVPPNTTMRALMDMLVRGAILRHPVTWVEGWTIWQFREKLATTEYCAKTLSELSIEQVMERLGLAGASGEGRFFPDTYYCNEGVDDFAILKQAQQRMERVLIHEWVVRAPDCAVNSPYEALILASIIEKETGQASERPLISGVFSRRLRFGMPLQSDPTVIYGMGREFRGNLTKADLQRDSPYNTYRISGLPPTPIASPGLDALRAALHPDGGNTLYFVARGDGHHVFTATLDDHNRAVKTYQKQKH